MNAIEQIETHYNDRSRRAREWHEAGKKVIGYFCCFVPEEIIAALGMLPFRIHGRPGEAIDQADAFIAGRCKGNGSQPEDLSAVESLSRRTGL